MSFADKVARKVENRLANKVAGAITDSAVKGTKSIASKGGKGKAPKERPVKDVQPKRDISKEIRKHKRQFDYWIVRTEDGPCFLVDASMKLDKAVELYLGFFPEADPMAGYSEGRARYNVTDRTYELVSEDAPIQGTFPVHVFRMGV